MKRYAVVPYLSGIWPEEVERVRRYMPDNYEAHPTMGQNIIIVGEDVAGWTLHGYVIPRLASGATFAREITEEEAAAVYGYEPEEDEEFVRVVLSLKQMHTVHAALNRMYADESEQDHIDGVRAALLDADPVK